MHPLQVTLFYPVLPSPGQFSPRLLGMTHSCPSEITFQVALLPPPANLFLLKMLLRQSWLWDMVYNVPYTQSLLLQGHLSEEGKEKLKSRLISPCSVSFLLLGPSLLLCGSYFFCFRRIFPHGHPHGGLKLLFLNIFFS